MWLPVILYLVINSKSTLSFAISDINEPLELTHLFLENLKGNPLILDDNELSEKSKRFIEDKIDNFVNLVSQSQEAEFSRTKRSLDEERNISRYAINVTSEKIVLADYTDDIRIFQHNSDWFAVSLHDKSKLTIFQYKNGYFKEIIAKNDIKYSTNIAVVSPEDEFPLIAAGQNKEVIIFQFIPTKPDLKIIQNLPVSSPQHVVMWEQHGKACLSITDNLYSQSNDTEDKLSKIKIYNWLGRHFDLIQEIDLLNIKKSVPFDIHGSHFLAAVKYKRHYDEMKSYSEIFKYDLHDSKFKPYQRVLTNGCTDIKYFTSELQGERHYFLVVVHSAEQDLSGSNLRNGSKSVIYKYEDQYFIPFQSIETNAVEWQPIQDMQGHAALIAVTKEGFKGFQYDGWRFFESHIVSDDSVGLEFDHITALHTFDVEEHRVLVVACEHCKNTTNIFKVKFSHFNTMKELHSEILSWCRNSLKELESVEESELVAESLRGDLNEQISIEDDQKHQLAAILSESNEFLIVLEELVNNSLQFNDSHMLNSDINAENVIFNNEVTFKSLRTTTLNEVNIDTLFDNVLDIVRGFVLNNPPEFSVIVSESPLTPRIINNMPLERYIVINDDLTLNSLVINGTVTFADSVNVENSLNNVTVDRQSLLLMEGDQEFSRDLTIDDIIVHNLTATNFHFDTLLDEEELHLNINDVKIDNLTTNVLKPKSDQKSRLLSHIKKARVKNLNIGGLLNNVSVAELEKRALKKSGDQILEGLLHVDSLNVGRLNVGGKVSGKNVTDDFVMINGGDYTVNQDVNFLKGLNVNKLEVLNSLNNIAVTVEGELDILLTDSPKIQSIPAKKSFENLIITNPIILRNKIKNAQMDRINPVIIDSDSYDLDGDVTIEGTGEVTRWISVADLKARNGGRGVWDVLEKGVKITDSQIPVHLTFAKPLDLDDTIAERVNLLNPHDWLLQTSDSPQIITGQKTFLGDLHLKGPVNTFRLNDVDVHKLHTEVLRVAGDQEIDGVLEVNKVVANQGVTSNNTLFGEHSWNPDAHSFQNEPVQEFYIINGNLKVNITKVENLEVKGLLNSLNISETIVDVLRKDAESKVFGQKTFTELHVDELIVQEKDLDLIKLLKDIGNNEVTLNKNIYLNNGLNVENINFIGNFNNITRENFENMMNFKSANDDLTIVAADRDYNEITVLGEMFISDNSINGKNLTAIYDDTVKADEDHEFDNVNFGEAVFVYNSIQLGGNVENLDLNNIVEQNSTSVMEINDKLFSEQISIEGTLNVEDTVNGFDLKRFCEVSTTSEHLKVLKIKGDVMFVKGPGVLNINGVSVANLMENLWFVDREANISGTMRVQNATFYSSVSVKEFIDTTNLKLLSQNYLSKSKDQTVPAVFSFDDVTFASISTPKLAITGPINGIILDDLLNTMLFDNVTQVFEIPAYFEEVQVKVLNDDTTYSVNGLNLQSDVMLYDAPNAVTGHKIVKNLISERLKVNSNIKIQHVDVLEWLSNAMLTSGSFSVTGKKIFKAATFKHGLSLRGALNDQEFNEKTVMIVDTPQNITGLKNFLSPDEDITKFKILKIYGLVNDMDLERFLLNQSNKDEHNIFNSEIVFNNSVVVKNINMDIIYDDVNVTELLHNITKLGALQHLQEKYKNLLDMSLVVENSVKGQTSFFKYFKNIMSLENVYDVFGVRCKDNVFRLLAFSFKNGTNIFNTFEWNIYENKFIHSGSNVESYAIPNFMEQVTIGDKDYIYMEHPRNHYGKGSYEQLYVGELLRLINSTTFEPVTRFERNETRSIISFVPPELNRPCLGFIDFQMTGMEILCEEPQSNFYKRFQTIHMENVYKATTVCTSNSLYLFLARQGLPFKDPSIVVFESSLGSPEFKETQIIFEGADLNGLTAAVIYNVPHVAFSFGPREASIDSGRISIRRLDQSTHQFVHWQHIPLTAPLSAHFVMENYFEPLLLAPTADASSPLQTLRYDGSAGFKKSFKGAALPLRSRIRIIQRGTFLVALQDDRSAAVILGAVIRGPIRN